MEARLENRSGSTEKAGKIALPAVGLFSSSAGLAAQAEVCDLHAVAVQIFVLAVSEQAPALADLLEQAAAALVILLVDL